MGFGDFMKGMQGGIGTMDDLYNSKQKRKLYDYAISDSENAMDAKDRSRARAKLPPLKRLMGEDPFLFRFLSKLGGGDSAIDSQPDLNPALEVTAPNTDVEMAPDLSAVDSQTPPELGFADGGALPDKWDYVDNGKAGGDPKAKKNWDSSESVKERAAQNRARPSAPPPDAVNAPKEAPSAAARARGALELSADAGKLRRGVNAVGKAAALPALAATGVTAAMTPTEQYRKRFGLETNDPSLAGDVGVRALGAASDLGNVLTFGQAGRFYRDMQPEDQAAPAPAAAIPAEAPMSGPTGPRSRGGSRAPAAAIPTAPAAAAPQDPENIDWSKIKAIDVPQMSTQDWTQFREQNIQELVDRGMSYAEAWDQVDQQVIATQQRGFTNFAKQGLALLQAGRTEEAGAAVRAAFQYIASTTDLEVGVHNGHLVAFGKDEQTGQPEGTPVVVTPQLLEGIMMQFQDPKSFATLQNDRKKLDQQDRGLNLEERKLNEVLIPGMENEGAYQRAAALDKMGGSGGTGLKPADIDRVRTQFFDPKANELVMGLPKEQQVPGLVEAITRALEEDYINGAGSPAQLVVEIQRVLMQPDGPAKIMRAYGQ